MIVGITGLGLAVAIVLTFVGVLAARETTKDEPLWNAAVAFLLLGWGPLMYFIHNGLLAP